MPRPSKRNGNARRASGQQGAARNGNEGIFTAAGRGEAPLTHGRGTGASARWRKSLKLSRSQFFHHDKAPVEHRRRARGLPPFPEREQAVRTGLDPALAANVAPTPRTVRPNAVAGPSPIAAGPSRAGSRDHPRAGNLARSAPPASAAAAAIVRDRVPPPLPVRAGFHAPNYVTPGDFTTYYMGNPQFEIAPLTVGGDTYAVRRVIQNAGGVSIDGKTTDSTLFATQSTFFRDRRVATFGYRVDTIQLRESNSARATATDPRVVSERISRTSGRWPPVPPTPMTSNRSLAHWARCFTRRTGCLQQRILEAAN